MFIGQIRLLFGSVFYRAAVRFSVRDAYSFAGGELRQNIIDVVDNAFFLFAHR